MRKTAALIAVFVVISCLFPPSVAGQGQGEWVYSWIHQFSGMKPPMFQYTAAAAGGDLYIAGWTSGSLSGQPSIGGYDAFIRKYNPDGVELWTRQFGTTFDDVVNAITVDSTGIYVVGYTAGAFPGQTSSSYQDAFIRKYDKNGNELWTRQFGSPSDDSAQAVAVYSTGVYIAGYAGNALPGKVWRGGKDAFLRKYSPAGKELWTVQFGGSGDDSMKAIGANASGLYTGGDTTVSEGISPVLYKFDLTGHLMWSDLFPASNTGAIRAIGLEEKGVYVAGTESQNVRMETAFIRKYSLAGNMLWSKNLKSTSFVSAISMAVYASTIYVSGRTGGSLCEEDPLRCRSSAGFNDAYILALNPDGSTQWMDQFGEVSDDIAKAVCAGSSGVFVTGSIYKPYTNENGEYAFIRKYNAAGTYLWTNYFSPNTIYDNGFEDSANTIAANGSEIFVGGYSQYPLAGQMLPGIGGAFIRKYASDGKALWTVQIPASSIKSTAVDSYINSIAVDSSGIYLAGSLSFISPDNSRDSFVRKIDHSGNELWTDQFGSVDKDEAKSIAVDSTGVYVGGYTDAALPGQVFSAGHDGYIRKYDLNGHVLWTREFGFNSEGAWAIARSIALDNSGVYVVCRSYHPLVFIRKYDLSGKELWTRTWDILESELSESLLSIAANPTGIYVVAGPYIKKYDPEGNESWTRQVDIYKGFLNVIALAPSGIYVAGGRGGGDVKMLAYDYEGNLLSSFQMYTNTHNWGGVSGIVVGSTGVYMAGRQMNALPGQFYEGQGDAYILKLNYIVSRIFLPSIKCAKNLPSPPVWGFIKVAQIV